MKLLLLNGIHTMALVNTEILDNLITKVKNDQNDESINELIHNMSGNEIVNYLSAIVEKIKNNELPDETSDLKNLMKILIIKLNDIVEES